MIQRIISSIWFKTAVSLTLGGLGLWLVTRDLELNQLLTQTRNISWRWVLIGVLIILATIMTKAWRWQLLFYPAPHTIDFPSLRNALVLGQFFNLLLPAARLGDVTRIVSLDQDVNKAQILGTLVLEKTLDMIMVVLTIFLLLPFVVLPDVINSPTLLAITATLAFGILYLLAYQTKLVITIAQFCARILPAKAEQFFLRLVVAGLDGLAALRNVRVAFNLLLISAFIALLSALTPYVLFKAFGFQLGLGEAAALNIALLIGSIPSSAPANLGVFEFLTITVLRQFGLDDENGMFSYALLFHMVVLLPVLIWGSWCIARGNWRWITSISYGPKASGKKD